MTEPRVPIIGPDVSEVAKHVEALRIRFDAEGRDPAGLVIHLYQMLGHAPDLLNAWSGLGRGLRVDTELSPAIRELAILRGSLLANAIYEWAHHFDPAVKAGHDPAKLAQLGTWTSSTAFDEIERAVLALTDEMVQAYKPSDATWVSLEAHFGDKAKVELVTLIAFYACVSRILLTLQIPVESSYFDGEQEWSSAWIVARAGLPG